MHISKTVKILFEVVGYGSFDDGLAVLLSDPLDCVTVRDHIHSFYFPEERLAYYRDKQLNDGFFTVKYNRWCWMSPKYTTNIFLFRSRKMFLSDRGCSNAISRTSIRTCAL